MKNSTTTLLFLCALVQTVFAQMFDSRQLPMRFVISDERLSWDSGYKNEAQTWGEESQNENDQKKVTKTKRDEMKNVAENALKGKEVGSATVTVGVKATEKSTGKVYTVSQTFTSNMQKGSNAYNVPKKFADKQRSHSDIDLESNVSKNDKGNISIRLDISATAPEKVIKRSSQVQWDFARYRVVVSEKSGGHISNFMTYFVFNQKSFELIEQYVSPNIMNKSEDFTVTPFCMISWENRDCTSVNANCSTGIVSGTIHN